MADTLLKVTKSHRRAGYFSQGLLLNATGTLPVQTPVSVLQRHPDPGPGWTISSGESTRAAWVMRGDVVANPNIGKTSAVMGCWVLLPDGAKMLDGDFALSITSRYYDPKTVLFTQENQK